MNSIKILLINDFLNGGGAEEVFKLTKDLFAIKHEVRVFYGKKNIEKPNNIFDYLYSFKNKKKLDHVLNEFKPDVIHIHNYYHYLTSSIFWSISRWKKYNSVKVVFTAHDFFTISPSSHLLHYKNNVPVNLKIDNAFKRQIFKKIDKRGFVYSTVKKINWVFTHKFISPLNDVDVIISPSHFLIDVFKRNGVNNKMICVRNPLKNANNLVEKSIVNEVEKTNFVFFGRLSEEKGLKRFILNCIKYNLDLNLDIIGDGELSEDLSFLIEKHQLKNIKLIGRISNNELIKKLKEYDVSIIPSIGFENAPLTIPESAAAGLMIFGSDLGGIKELCVECGVIHFLYSKDSFLETFSKLKKSIITNDTTSNIVNLTNFTEEIYIDKLEQIYCN